MTRARLSRIKKLYELSCKERRSRCRVFDSKGGDINEGMEVLADYGDIIKASAAISGVVPQIAVITGVCAGAAAVIASMADVTIMTEKAELFLNAPFNTPDGKLEGAGQGLQTPLSPALPISLLRTTQRLSQRLRSWLLSFLQTTSPSQATMISQRTTLRFPLP